MDTLGARIGRSNRKGVRQMHGLGYGLHGFGGAGATGPLDGLGMVVTMGFGVLFVVGAIALVVWLALRAPSTAPSVHAAPLPFAPPAPVDPALRIAKERFAKGEITAEEYRGIVETLRG